MLFLDCLPKELGSLNAVTVFTVLARLYFTTLWPRVASKIKMKTLFGLCLSSHCLSFFQLKIWLVSSAGIFFLFMPDCCDSLWWWAFLEGLDSSREFKHHCCSTGCLPGSVWSWELRAARSHAYVTENNMWLHHICTVLTLALPYFNLSNLPLSLVQIAPMQGA